MTLEEALIDLGDHPLSKSPFSKTIRAIVVGLMGQKQVAVTMDMTGISVLGMVYEMTDQVKQEQILKKELGAIRSTDRYRTVVVGFSFVIAMLAIMLATAEVTQDNPVTDGGSQVLQEIVRGMFDVIKAAMSMK